MSCFLRIAFAFAFAFAFACTGNTGRSVMAAALSRRWFDMHGSTA